MLAMTPSSGVVIPTLQKGLGEAAKLTRVTQKLSGKARVQSHFVFFLTLTQVPLHPRKKPDIILRNAIYILKGQKDFACIIKYETLS